MSATIIRLHPEPPVNPRVRLVDACLQFLLLSQIPPCPSELIDQLAHTTNPNERQALADLIARSAP